MPSIDDVLHANFGLEQFRPGQREVIEHLMAGRSAAAVFPTGGGKSLCYQLPAQLLAGLSLVVSPLIALMKDQIDRLQARGMAADRLDSTRTLPELSEIMNGVRSGRIRLLYVAPERFNNERFREAITRLRIALFAVDEAHCISEWGHNFRPDYLKLAAFAREVKAERVLALTATATPQVLGDICRGFGIAADCAICTGVYRSTLPSLVRATGARDRDAELLDRLAARPAGPTIVYVTLQRTAEQVAKRLAAAGHPARAYHAGMEDAERARVQDWFLQSDRAIVVATIAFGMGIDKSNIRYVYHYNLPKSLENFAQEIGRAGRDGEKSLCEMFVCPDDLNALENFAYGDTPAPDAVRGLIEHLFSLGAEFDASLHELSARHDIRLLVVRTLLTYLELDGHMSEGTPFYNRYQFRPRANSADILSRFEGERRSFLDKLLRAAEQAKTWFHIDLDRAVEATGAPRERIVRALDYLADQQLLELKVEEVRHRFRRHKTPASTAELAAQLYQRMTEREAREIARIREVLELAGHDGCLASRLGAHFGEPLEKPCGSCSWCSSGGRRAELLPHRADGIDESVWSEAAGLRAEHSDPLADPRAFTRLLCGISSPRLTRARLSSNRLFGALAHVPFSAVLRRAEQDGQRVGRDPKAQDKAPQAAAARSRPVGSGLS